MPVFLFHFLLFVAVKLIDSVRKMSCMVSLSPLGAIQQRAWVTTSTPIVKLEVETV